MQDTSRRTGVTGLTNAEMELLDIAAIQIGSRAALRSEFFSRQHNRPDHGLNDAALQATLDRFEKEGWTIGENYTSPWSKSDRSVRLTPKGGQLWETERLPDWSRHVMDVGGGHNARTKRDRVCAFGHSPAIVRAFFEAACACGFFGVPSGLIRTGVATRQWVYWRPPQPLYLLTAWTRKWSWHTDWERMEAMRTWWRFPDEIGKLWGLPSA